MDLVWNLLEKNKLACVLFARMTKLSRMLSLQLSAELVRTNSAKETDDGDVDDMVKSSEDQVVLTYSLGLVQL